MQIELSKTPTGTRIEPTFSYIPFYTLRPFADTSLLSLINKRVKKAPKVSASKDTTRWRCMYEGLRGLSLVSFMNFE
jgi:hypothetical protein